MNKALHFLLFTGLAAILSTSCSKDETSFLIPESYQRNEKPFSVVKIPSEGGIITLDRVTKDGDVIYVEHLDPGSNSTVFSAGDSLVLTATPKNGFTFINWVRNGGDKVIIKPTYGFKLEASDLLPDKNGYVKHHYEARFGLDYALQVIPSIDEVMPADLIAAMGPYLHFGDNPPRIDTCFSISDYLFLDTLIKKDPNEEYGFAEYPKKISFQYNTFLFERQHRCIAEAHYYERCNWLDLFYYYANVSDSIFIMGHDDYFTAYFHQTWKAWVTPGIGVDHLGNVTRRESVILSGKVGIEGIEDLHWGMRVESYNPANYPYIGLAPGNSGQPGIHDIMIFSSDRIFRYEPNFQKHNFQ